MERIQSINDLEKIAKSKKEQLFKRPLISISSGTCGQARGSLKVVDAFKRAAYGLEDMISIKVTGCHGFCSAEPNVIVFPDEIFYSNLKPEHAGKIVHAVLKGEPASDFLYKENGNVFLRVKDIPFYKAQLRVLLSDNPLVDPTSIEDYIAIGGYQALAKALEMKQEEVIEEVKRSGLRGRGGAGFPTGLKWEITRRQKEEMRFVICNADEGDPGAYMDRSLLEGNPHRVIEGMLIGAYAIGASIGYVYVRNEYPLAIKNLTEAIKQAHDYGFVGKNILGTDFNFIIKINRGGGAFVCGEETALMQSVEGRPGDPRPRPPYPSEKGLWEYPTVINNVETWANVTKIMEKGADWFASIGTEGSKGTKIFSLVGKVKNTGLVEVPMGMAIEELIYKVGGGGQNGKKLKAIQIGGPSGGCIPKELFKQPIDYESLTFAGAIMGSGGLIVMDERTCMLDVAKYFLKFLKEESCGKCTPCREGVERMHEILENITLGKGRMEDIALLEELAEVVKDASLCGLGKTAPNPVLTTLRYFRKEYEAHINERKCPAGVCKELIRYEILDDVCNGCGACLRPCSQGAISGEKKKVHKIDQTKCIKCGICYDVCKFDAIAII
ncbi:MAG: NADH-quinone oxidoreductase subunit NuoF [Candidatus Aminicenantia bacterium]